MGGLAGVVGVGAIPDADLVLCSVCASLPEGSHSVDVFTATRGIALGVAYRSRNHVAHEYSANLGVGVVLYGSARLPGSHKALLSTEDVLDGFVSGGTAWLTSLDGSFLIAVVDDRTGQFFLLNDRTATIPLHYVVGEGIMSFGPTSSAALALLKRALIIDPVGSLHFLATGRGGADRTLLQGAKLLGPASIVHVDTRSPRWTVDRYWRLAFAPPARRMTPREATDAAYEACSRAVHETLSAHPGSHRILLSGGYDSRLLLAMAVEQKRAPVEALTWGASDDIPASDPITARRVSDAMGVPHRFLRQDETGFGRHWRDWLRTCELMTDNLGSFASGDAALSSVIGGDASVIIGDHVLGIGGIPLDRRDAIETATKLPLNALPQALERLIHPSSLEKARWSVWEGLEHVVREHDDANAKDLKDRLGFQLGLTRWLNAPTFFREPSVLPTRPFLSADMLRFFQELPPHLRVDKVLIVRLLQARYPRLSRIPVASRSALIDWDAYFWGSGHIRQLLGDGEPLEAIESSPIAQFIDVGRVRSLLAKLLANRTTATTVGSSSSRMSVTGIRRAMSRSYRLGALARQAQVGLRRLKGQGPSLGNRRLMLRMALLAQFARVVADTDHRPRRCLQHTEGTGAVWSQREAESQR